MRERAFADDTGVALASDASLNRLFEIADQYSLGSGSKLQVKKTVGFRFGTAKAVTPPPEHLLTWHRYGIDPVPPQHKYLGNALGTPDQVAAQWEAKLGELEAELDQALLSAKIPLGFAPASRLRIATDKTMKRKMALCQRAEEKHGLLRL